MCSAQCEAYIRVSALVKFSWREQPNTCVHEVQLQGLYQETVRSHLRHQGPMGLLTTSDALDPPQDHFFLGLTTLCLLRPTLKADVVKQFPRRRM